MRLYDHPPTVEQLLKHAEKFGGAMVAETAARVGYPVETVALILQRIEVLEAQDPKNKYAPKKRGSVEDRAQAIIDKERPPKKEEQGERPEGV